MGDLTADTALMRLFVKYPEVAILINNLGIYEAAEFSEITDADWRSIF